MGAGSAGHCGQAAELPGAGSLAGVHLQADAVLSICRS